jgi:type II secretory pathway component PulF
MNELTRKERERADYRLKAWIKKDRERTEIEDVNNRLDRLIAMVNSGVPLRDAEDLLAQEEAAGAAFFI